MDTLNRVLNAAIIFAVAVVGWLVYAENSHRVTLKSFGWVLNDASGLSGLGLGPLHFDGCPSGLAFVVGAVLAVVVLWVVKECRK